MTTYSPLYFREDDPRYHLFCLSHHALFTSAAGDQHFTSITQYLQYRKALLFYDFRAAEDILATSDTTAIMGIARRINGFQKAVWGNRRPEVVQDGLMLKFGQNEEFRWVLLDTGTRELVYAVGTRDWGVGFVPRDAGRSRDSWGENLLGKSLMEVRRKLRKYADATGTYPKARLPLIGLKMSSLSELGSGDM